MPAPAELTLGELAQQTGELLPARTALALVDITNVIAVNLAIAVNAGLGGSATAVANQAIVPAP